MIVLRRPWVLYDVDVVGAAVAALLIALGCWQIPARWSALARQYRSLSDACRLSETRLAAEAPALAEAQHDIEEFAAAVALRDASFPRTAALGSIVNDLTGDVRRAGLELISVSPQPPKQVGIYDQCEIPFSARGSAVDFARFLDEVGQRFACAELTACAITRASKSGDATCSINWALRLTLLSDRPVETKGAKP